MNQNFARSGLPSRPRILLIDDTPANLMMLGSALELEFDLQIATSGEMGLKLASSQTPDLILLDIMMPEMDGFETCRRMKAMPALQQTPVIFVTAVDEVNAEATGLALGAADFISKPINVEIARQRICNLIERERLRREVEVQRDLLERRVAERTADLEASEACFRGLIEQSVVGVFQFQQDRILYVNPGFARLHGFDSPAEIVGQFKALDLVAPEDRERVEAWAKTLVLNEPQRMRFTGLRQDGRRIMLETHIRLLRDGVENELIGFVIDISGQKGAEAAQAAALAAAEKLAVLKTHFVNNMSHELRTPLHGVIGLANLGQRSPDLAKAYITFRRIQDSAGHLLGLVENVLNFSAAESGGLVIRQQAFDLRETLLELAGHWQSRAEAKHVSFSLAGMPEQAVGCIGDVERLKQVVDQLLGNAVKFTAQGGVGLSIELNPRAARVACRLEITDSGIGMSPEQLHEAFNPFQQIDGGLTRRFGGMGLGLALVKHLVSLMDGQISVESQLGQGTRFAIDLTFVPASLPRSGVPARPKTTVSARPLRVVLAIGSAVNRMLVEAYLAVIDARVEAFEQAGSLCEKLKANAGEFDMLVTDLHFPDLSDAAFLKQVRLVAPGLPLIKLHDDDDGREIVVQMQPKPFEAVRAGATEIDFSTTAFKHFLETVQELGTRSVYQG